VEGVASNNRVHLQEPESISRGSCVTISGDDSWCLDVVTIYQYSAVPDMAL